MTIQHRTKIVKIFLQYCIPSQATSGAESGNHPKVNSIRPYFLARRLFTGDTAFRDMALFLLHLLQIEIPRCTNPLFVSQFDENTIEISTPKVVRVSQTPKQFISNVPSSPWLHQSLTPTLAHVVNSEDSEKNQTMDSIQSTQDFEMISSLYVPHLSPKDLESMWDCHERINTAPEDGIISSNPFGSSDNHQNNHSTNDILTPQTTDGHESPTNSHAPRSFPIPIGLHLTINSDDNDLLIQGRQGIGSFDISILSSDMTTVSLAVSGQLIHFTFEDSSVLTVPSTAVPVPPNSPINDVLTTCHIHLDIHSLALGYIQAIRKRIFESNIQGSDNTSTEPHG